MGVLSFDGTNDLASASTLASALANVPGGAWTIGFLVKHRGTGTFDALGYLVSSGTATVGLSFESDNELLADIPDSVNNATALNSTTAPYILLVSRPAGTNQDITYSWKLDTGGAWTHSTRTAANVDNQAAATALELAVWQTSNDFGHIFLGVVGIWARELTQGQKESLDDNWRTSDWWNVAGGSPVCLVECNTTSLVDLAGNATGWSVSGATVDGAETLSSWNFDGTGAAATTSMVFPRRSHSGLIMRGRR